MKYTLSAEIDKNKKNEYLMLWRLKQKDSLETINWVISHIVEGVPFRCCREEE